MKITKQRTGLPTAAIAAILALAGCADENPWGTASEEKGKISLTLTAESDIATSKPSVGGGTRATGDLSDFGVTVPAAEDFTIKLEKKDGNYAKTWATLTDFREEASETGFTTGAYTMTASYGKKGEQGFDKPYFEASSTFTVLSDHTSEVSMTAEMQNALVAVNYTDNLRKYLQNYSVRVHTEGNAQDVVFSESENRPGCIEAGNATLSITYSKKGSDQSSTLEIGNFASVAKTLYNITMDVTEPNGGDATLTVKFNGAIDEEHTIEIPMTDNVAAAPEITCIGFENGGTVEMLESTASLQAIKMNVKARGLIDKAILTVQADNGSRPSWGGEIDLCATNESEQRMIAEAGIDATGFFKNPDIYGIVDLTGFGKSMSKGRYTVSLRVTDKNGKMSEPAVAVLDCQQIELSNVGATSMFGTGTATLTMNYNGQNPMTDVTFRALNDKGNMVEARVKSAEEITGTRGFETKQYRYELEIPINPKKEIDAEAYHCGTKKATFMINSSAPSYQISQADAFSRYAYLKISNASGNASELATIIRYIRVKSGNDELNITSRDEAEGILTIGALKPGSTYALETSILAGEWNTGSTIATESELTIPNGDFSENGETLTSGSLLVGGDWYPTVIKAYHHNSSFSRILPKYWSTINDITAAPEGQVTNYNTWYIVPSSWLDNGRGFMRNVGYNHNGRTIGDPKGTSTDYYCKDHPQDSELNKAAGILSLGSYDFSNGMSSGISFNSRPSGISFDYEYKLEAKEQKPDNGYAYVEILDGNGNSLGLETLELTAGTGSKSIVFNYGKFGAKASTLKIYFKSSNQSTPPIHIPTGSELNEGFTVLGNKTIDPNKYHAVATGSELWIDNVTAHYGEAPEAAKAPKRTKNVNSRR